MAGFPSLASSETRNCRSREKPEIAPGHFVEIATACAVNSSIPDPLILGGLAEAAALILALL